MCKVNPVKNNSVLFLSVAETNSLCHIAIERYSIKIKLVQFYQKPVFLTNNSAPNIIA